MPEPLSTTDFGLKGAFELSRRVANAVPEDLGSNTTRMNRLSLAGTANEESRTLKAESLIAAVPARTSVPGLEIIKSILFVQPRYTVSKSRVSELAESWGIPTI